MFDTNLIIIFAMPSWGEKGNLLSAHSLADALKTNLPNVAIEIVEAESFFPSFYEIGKEIELISKSDKNITAKLQAYYKLMGCLEVGFPEETELNPAWPKELYRDGLKLSEYIEHKKPRIVIGTKGIIARMLYKSTLNSSNPPLVVSYVTNEGLIELAIHRSKYMPLTIVQYERIRLRLINNYGYDSSRVVTVGKLTAKPQASDAVENCSNTELPIAYQRIMIVSIRGGINYLKILKYLGEKHRDIGVLFISLNDPQLFQAASELKSNFNLDRQWAISTHLNQREYLSALQWLKSCGCPIFISKTGPNTMLEAATFGVAQLLLRSGLPQEKWVGRYLTENGIGLAFDDCESLIGQLEIWLRDRTLIKKCCKQAVLLHGTGDDDKQVQLKLKHLFQSLMPS